MRILLPIIQFPPDVNPTGLLMAQLCEGLAAYGHEVSVITAFRIMKTFACGMSTAANWFNADVTDNMDVIRLYVYAPGKKTMVNRLYELRLVQRISDHDRSHCLGVTGMSILCPNGSFFSGLSAWVLEKFEIRAVYLQRPGSLSRRADPRRTTAQSLRDRRLEVDGKFHVPQSGAYHGHHAERCGRTCWPRGCRMNKISVIPNFVDTEFIRPLPRDNDFAGSMVCLTNLSSAMREASATCTISTRCWMRPQLLAAQKDIVFLIIGNGVAKAALEKKAARPEAGQRPLHAVSAAREPALDEGLFGCASLLYRNGAANDSFSSKIYEIMASGRPLLASGGHRQ